MHRTLWPSLLIAAAIGAVITLLPLEPRIAPGFFFAQDSKALEEIRIQEKRFGSQALLMVIARSPNIDTPHYAQQITQLSEALAALPGIITVRSLSNGPDDLADALDSPIWNRLLLYPDGQASNLILVLDSAEPAASQVPEVEKVLNQHRRPDFDLLQTGVPYVVHSIGSELQSEFRRLGGLAVLRGDRELRQGRLQRRQGRRRRGRGIDVADDLADAVQRLGADAGRAKRGVGGDQRAEQGLVARLGDRHDPHAAGLADGKAGIFPGRVGTVRIRDVARHERRLAGDARKRRRCVGEG